MPSLSIILILTNYYLLVVANLGIGITILHSNFLMCTHFIITTYLENNHKVVITLTFSK